jgi:hypothetical protein
MMPIKHLRSLREGKTILAKYRLNIDDRSSEDQVGIREEWPGL